jgi:hypothetical protein
MVLRLLFVMVSVAPRLLGRQYCCIFRMARLTIDFHQLLVVRRSSLVGLVVIV